MSRTDLSTLVNISSKSLTKTMVKVKETADEIIAQKDAEIKRLNQQIESTEEQLDYKDFEGNKLLSSLEQELEELQQTLEETKIEGKKELANLKLQQEKEIDELKANQRMEIEELEEEIRKAEDHARAYIESRSRVEGMYQRTQEQYANKDNSFQYIDSSNEQIIGYQNRLQKAKEDSAKAESTLEQLKSQLAHLTKKHQTLEKSILYNDQKILENKTEFYKKQKTHKRMDKLVKKFSDKYCNEEVNLDNNEILKEKDRTRFPATKKTRVDRAEEMNESTDSLQFTDAQINKRKILKKATNVNDKTVKTKVERFSSNKKAEIEQLNNDLKQQKVIEKQNKAALAKITESKEKYLREIDSLNQKLEEITKEANEIEKYAAAERDRKQKAKDKRELMKEQKSRSQKTSFLAGNHTFVEAEIIRLREENADLRKLLHKYDGIAYGSLK